VVVVTVDLSTAYRCAANLAAKAHFDPSRMTVAEQIELNWWRTIIMQRWGIACP
jgi:hypothetical protein